MIKEHVSLCGLRLFNQAQAAARQHAKERNEAIAIIRTKAGFRVTDARSVCFGEFWKVEPSGQVTHNGGPVT